MSNIRSLRTTEQRGAFLVVDPDDASARNLARWIRTARWEPVVAKTLDLDHVAKLTDGCGGVMLSLDLSDDLALEIRTLKDALPDVPLAVLGVSGLDAVIQAQALGVHYICRPASFASIFSFADGLRPVAKGPVDPQVRIVEFGKRIGLTPREGESLLVADETSNHKDICARLGIAQSTLKTYVKRMRARARDHGILAASLKELVLAARTTCW